ncbi:DUF3023 domain-containing protein [Ehrlichia minasensis]|uniref:DUF3023 domain-containing protein n=1 Tax=Ehrlichia minasensis TaxID=1242993 RepID=A0A4Q6I541_9RICK|nr:DUF3023 domain-containing protein [Ehrlichia minasensis]RZB13035.1 DUF3023 domain-containing protein [Ehrlichia minasensis]
MWSVLKQKILGSGEGFDENQEKRKEEVNKELLEKSRKIPLKEEAHSETETAQSQESSTQETPQIQEEEKIEHHDEDQETSKVVTSKELLEKKEAKYTETTQSQKIQELSAEEISQGQKEQPIQSPPKAKQTELYEKAGARPKTRSGVLGKKIEKKSKKQLTKCEIEEKKKAEIREEKQEEEKLKEALSKLKGRPLSCVESILSHYDEEERRNYQELANMVQIIKPNDITVKSTKCIGNTDEESGKMHISCNRSKSCKVAVKGNSLFIVNCRLSNKYLSENTRVNDAFPPKDSTQRKRKAIVYCFVACNDTDKFLETCSTTLLSSRFSHTQCPFNFCKVKYVHFYTKHQNNKNLDLSDEKKVLENFGGLTNVEFIDSRPSPSSSLSSSPSISGSSSSHSSSPT